MSFASEYKKLNPTQKQAVDAIEGPVMVMAGPGTGKTHILTLRIANILKHTDVEPHNILALTFTDSAAKTMRVRLIALIGQPAYGVRIETFHALCDGIISEYPEFFPFELDSLPITQVEQFDLIRSLLNDPQLKFLRTPGSKYHYARDLIGAISALKREGITPERLAELVEDETIWFEGERESLKKMDLLKWEPLIGKHRELIGIYGKYQQTLRTKARYDFDDMLLEVHRALLSHPLLLSALQEQFQYILVDEYQDTNGVQNAIVDTLASFWEEPNLFVVGDPNQTIFRFQGALLENSLGFLDRYPKATVITLGHGYRSNQTVYDAAHILIQPTLKLEDHPLSGQLSQALKASHTHGMIRLQVSPTDTDELLMLVTNIQDLIQRGVPPEEIAVLYKRNAEGEILADLLSRAQIPFHTQRDFNALEDEVVSQFLNLLGLIQSLQTGSEQRGLFDVLGYDWFLPGKNLSSLTRLKLIRAFSSQRSLTQPFEFLSQDAKVLKKLPPLAQVGKEEWQNLKHLLDLLSSWSAQEGKLPFPQFVELVAKDSGLLSYLIPGKNPQALQSYITCFKEITKLARNQRPYRLSHFLTYITTMAEQGLSLPLTGATGELGITLSTVHKAKGKEWEHVFIPFLREGYWGKARSKGGLRLPEGVVKHTLTQDPEADERRLLFVALTRAKHTAHLSYSQTLVDGERSSDVIPSPFLTEIKGLIRQEEAKPDVSLHSLFIEPKIIPDVDAQTREWLRTLVDSFTLSYSSLNAYLEDPRLFYERYVLKLPEAVEPHLAFGNAVHAALEHYYKLYAENNTHPPAKQVLPTFEHQLSSYLLSPDDEQIRRAQGQRVLQEYLEAQASVFPQVVAIEESFGWRRGKVMLGETQLVGKIDRIDLSAMGEKHLKVVDYKTGKSKTLGDIEGKTKGAGLSARELSLPENIRGRMKRQLLFYKLLLSLDPKYRAYNVNEGVFEFVEPEKGKLISRSVSLEIKDVETLKELIETVSREIKALKFLETWGA